MTLIEHLSCRYRRARLLSCVCFALLVCLHGHAAAASQNDDADALESILESSIQTVMELDHWPCFYSGHFHQSRSLAGTGTTLKSTGQFFYSCEQGLLWEVQKPLLESVVYTHVARHFQLRKGGKVKVLKGRVQTHIADLLLGLLGGNAVELARVFDTRIDDAKSAQVTLTPKKKSLQQHIEKITLNSIGGKMTVVMIAPGNGNIKLEIDQLTRQTRLPVVACASISLQADLACRRLFDPTVNE